MCKNLGGVEYAPICIYILYICFSEILQPISSLDHLIVEASRSHTGNTHTHTHTVVLLWKNDQPVAEAATYTINNKRKRRTSMPSARFEPAIPAVKRLQTYAIDLDLHFHNVLCDEVIIILFTKIILSLSNVAYGRSQWSRGLRHGSAAACLLGLWVRIPPGAWMFACCVLSGRGLCDELITLPGGPTDCGASFYVV